MLSPIFSYSTHFFPFHSKHTEVTFLLKHKTLDLVILPLCKALSKSSLCFLLPVLPLTGSYSILWLLAPTTYLMLHFTINWSLFSFDGFNHYWWSSSSLNCVDSSFLSLHPVHPPRCCLLFSWCIHLDAFYEQIILFEVCEHDLCSRTLFWYCVFLELDMFFLHLFSPTSSLLLLCFSLGLLREWSLYSSLFAPDHL